MKYIVNCEVTEISDTDAKGTLLMKPVVNKSAYAKIFDTKEEVLRFLMREIVPSVQVDHELRAV